MVTKVLFLTAILNFVLWGHSFSQNADVTTLEKEVSKTKSSLTDTPIDSLSHEKLLFLVASQVNELAEWYFDKGEYDIATKLFIEAEDYTKQYNLSHLSRNKRYLLDAENKLLEWNKTEDKAKRDILLKTGHILVATYLSEVISNAEQLNDFESEKTYLQRLLIIAQEANDSSGLAKAYEKLGTLELNNDHTKEAFDLYDKAYKLRTGKNEQWWTVDYIAYAYWSIGEYEKALKEFEREINMLRTLEAAPVEEKFDDLITLKFTGKELEDMKERRRSNTRLERLNVRSSLASTISNKARIRLLQGKYGLAIDAIKEVKKINESLKEQLKNSNDETLKSLLTLSVASHEATSLRIIARIYEVEGKDTLAFNTYLEAVKLLSDLSGGKPSGAIAGIRGRMAVISTNQKKFEEARSNIKEVLRLRGRLKQEAGTVIALISSSRIERAANEKIAALKLARQAKAAALQLSYSEDILAEANENEADNLSDKAVDQNSLELEQAIVEYKTAIAVYRQSELLPMLARAFSSLGWAYERSAKFKESEASYSEAIKISESIKSGFSNSDESNAFSNNKETIQIYQRMVDLLVRLGKAEQALQYASRAQSRNLIDAIPKSEIKLTGKSAVDLKNVIDAENRVSAVRSSIEKNKKETHSTAIQNNLISSLGAAKQQYALAIKRLETEQPNVRFTVRPTDLLKLQTSILYNEAILSYLVTPAKLFIFVVKHNEVAVRTVDVTQEQLRGNVAAVRSGLSDFADEFYKLSSDPVTGFAIEKDRTDLRHPDGSEHFKMLLSPLTSGLTNLYEDLITPVQDLLNHVELLKIIPNSELFLLPFSALVSKQSNKYLIENYGIIYLTAGDLISSAPLQNKGSLVAFGNPTEANLEGAMDEVKAIKAAFPGGKIYTENAATKDQLFKLKQVKILHFATHGHIRSPLENSNIQLAHLPGIIDADLTYGEIYALPVESMEMVVLSACQTALGTVSGTEIGVFIEAFRSKTNTVVASLWSVDDVSTLELMKEFYKNLQAGKSKTVAMRNAQLKLLKDSRTKNPLFWSAFVMYGDACKISGTAALSTK